eukprot:jgi/Psemu1/286002/fgenesh1_pg.112_\
MPTVANANDEHASEAQHNGIDADEEQRRETETTTPSASGNVQNDEDERSFGMGSQVPSPPPLRTTVMTTTASVTTNATTTDHRFLRQRFHNCIDRWPRITALIRGQLLVCSLIVVTLLGGYILSLAEGPYEVNKNDSFLRQIWFINSIPIETVSSALVGLPTACLKAWYKQNSVGAFTQSQSQSQSQPEETTPRDTGRYTPSMIDLDLFSEEDSFWTDTNMTTVDFYRFVHSLVDNRKRHELNDIPSFDLPPVASFVKKNIGALPLQEDSDETDDGLLGNSASKTLVVSVANDTSKDAVTFVPAVDVYEAMVVCEQIAGELLQLIIDFTLDVAQYDFWLLLGADGGAAGLTFNWNRCWNDTELGSNIDPFRPSQKQVEASQYRNQTDYYTKRWNSHRKYLYRAYSLDMGCENITNENNNTESGNATTTVNNDRIMCYWEATKQSVLEATGKGGCQTNTGSSAWFWFTIMTTVGYGNFSPETKTGRILVWCLGWLSIIAFGGIMIVVGNTYTAILDDLLTRFNLQWMKRPVYSAAVWGSISVVWIVIIAGRARFFWDTNTPQFEYTLGDSYWFSYITVLTVGLGDFVLQPQGIFITDVFQWTALCLHGFIFISSFLGKVSDVLQAWIPEQSEPFEYHLARTDLWGRGYNTPISKSLEILKELEQDLKDKGSAEEHSGKPSAESRPYRTSFVGNDRALAPDGSTINHHRMRILMEKTKLLIRLLDDTQSELEDRVTRSFPLDDGHVEDRSDLTDRIDLYALYQAGQSLTTVEELHSEEQVLESTLLRTKQLRTYIKEFQSTSELPPIDPSCEP